MYKCQVFLTLQLNMKNDFVDQIVNNIQLTQNLACLLRSPKL